MEGNATPKKTFDKHLMSLSFKKLGGGEIKDSLMLS
jgi:hypothetical protein